MICELTKTNQNASYCVPFAKKPISNFRRIWKMRTLFAPTPIKICPDPDTFRTVKMIIKMTVHCFVRAIKCKYTSPNNWPHKITRSNERKRNSRWMLTQWQKSIKCAVNSGWQSMWYACYRIWAIAKKLRDLQHINHKLGSKCYIFV